MSYTIKTASFANYDSARILVRDNNKRLHVVYYRRVGNYPAPFNIYHSYSDDEGKTWTEEQISTDTENYHNNTMPSIAVDSSNNLYVVWVKAVYTWYPQYNNYYPNDEIAYSKFDGSSWSSPVVVTDCGAPNVMNIHKFYPAIAIDNDNNLHVVWYGTSFPSFPRYMQIQYIKYTGSWSTQIDLTSGNYHADTTLVSIATDSQDRVHIVFSGKSSSSPNQYQIQYIKYDGSWSAIVDLTSGDTYYQSYPCIAVDSNDYLHVVWTGSSDDTWNSQNYTQIRYSKYISSWSSPINLTDRDASQDGASIAIDEDDNLYVFCSGGAPYPETYRQIGMIKYDGSWGNIKYLTKGSPDKDFVNSLWARYYYSVEPKDKFHFVFLEDTSPTFTIKYYAPIKKYIMGYF